MKIQDIKYPALETIKCALFIQPHPDDNEIGAGGTMAYLTHKIGATVYGLTVTQGSGGSDNPNLTPEQLIKQRQTEANNAMAITNTINLGDLGYNNINKPTHDNLVNDFVNVIRKVKPDAVFTVDPKLEDEMHPVHILVGNAVCEAFMRASQAYYPFHENKYHEDAHSIKTIGFYFTDRDNTIVDISEFYQLKLDAIRAHTSQISNDYLNTLDQYFELISSDQSAFRIERLRLLNSIHTHCFALPKFIKDQL